MSHGGHDPQVEKTLAELVERLRTLGLPVWTQPDCIATPAPPTGWGDADSWFRSPGWQALLRTRQVWTTPGEPHLEVMDIFPGAWALCIRGTDTHPDVSAVAIALGPSALEGAYFDEICRSGDVPPRVAQAVLAPLATCDKIGLDRLAAVVDWTARDLFRICDDHDAIQNFSKQLVDSYEQMSMLYRVAESMNGLSDPHGFVRMACGLLLDTLEFDWISVRFSSLPMLGRGLANELIIEGNIPCSHTKYDKMAGELHHEAAIEDRPVVLDPKGSQLASLVRSEVFVNPLVCDEKLAGFLLAGNKRGEDPDISTVEMQLISATADYLSAFLHNSALYNEQRTMFLGIIKALSASIDAKDRYTRGHSERVAHLASQLAMATGMTDEQAERVRLAGILHDMGKIGVPEAVLLKPGRLTNEEYDAIKRHPTIGYNILKDIEPLQDVLPGVLYHHERWDGKGYPHGLAGGDIPLIGRILAVADAFDAMSSDRAYRPRIARDEVLTEMRTGAGTQWDRELIKLFLAIDLSTYDSMIDRHAAQDAMAA